MKEKITIRDVARHAGVSAASVSYVINGINKVSDETKERILKAIKELNYEPNLTAISLSKKKSNMIGVMFPLTNDSLAAIYQYPYYSEMISGLEYVSRKLGYDVLITGTNDAMECAKWINKRNIDGLLLLGEFPAQFYKKMKTLSTPIVLVDTLEKYENDFHLISVNDEKGGYLATKHLIDLGHRSIGFVAHRLQNSLIDERRFIGYKKALMEAHIEVCEDLLFEAHNSSFENGYKLGRHTLLHHQQMTAIFASSDTIALGIMKAFQEAGKQIPKDYSIVGFDDLKLSSYTSPSLTTIRQDVNNKGMVAATTLIHAIENRFTTLQQINLSVELMIRESTGKK